MSQDQPIVLDPTYASFDAAARPADLGATHFIGIGGAGMSVLAEMLHAEGVAVDGSDRAHSAKTDRLETLGITVEFGQRAENVAQAETVVYSSAIKPDNPEIVAAHAAGKRIVHRSDILALLMNGKRAVTVAGAHGKTTTSSMLSHILVNAGADPSYAIGGFIQGPDGTTLDGGHAGKGDILVAEADESDGSFAKYHPTIAIITNCEADHLDHYGDEAHYRAAFVAHAGRATGHVIISIDDPDGLAVLEAMPADVKSHTVAYGTTARESLPDLGGAAYVWIASESETAGSGVEQLTLHLPAAVTAGEPVSQSVALKVPGVHNARNAAAAISAAVLLGVSPADAAKAAGTFLGAARRFQVRGTVKQVTVVDDYAHHPTEIAALLDAARRRYPDSTIRVIFQPHLFSRTKFFAHQFAKSLAKADDVIITGIFPAREKQTDFPDISPSTIVDAAAGLKDASAGTWIQPVEDMCLAAKMMAMRAHHGDVIFTVGAGDIYTAGEKLLEKDGHVTSVGDEGGFAPNLKNHDEAFSYIVKAIEEAGYIPGSEVALAIDAAASEFYQDGKYVLKGENKTFNNAEMAQWLAEFTSKYPLISIEDGMAEEDWDGWKALTDRIGDKVQLVGFGTFEVRERAARTGINPQTKQTIEIAASKNPVFKAGKALKDIVNK